MAKREDLTGQRFGRLTVVSPAPNRNIITLNPDGSFRRARSYTMWNCKCDCGAERVVCSHQLKSGNSKSCGCLRADLTRERFKKHDG